MENLSCSNWLIAITTTTMTLRWLGEPSKKYRIIWEFFPTGGDPRLGKSTDKTMQLFYLCGFVQTCCNNGGLFLHTYTFIYALNIIFTKISWFIFAWLCFECFETTQPIIIYVRNLLRVVLQIICLQSAIWRLSLYYNLKLHGCSFLLSPAGQLCIETHPHFIIFFR